MKVKKDRRVYLDKMDEMSDGEILSILAKIKSKMDENLEDYANSVESEGYRDKDGILVLPSEN